jgi:glycosyltransferase involved in cell wall biosynthesis
MLKVSVVIPTKNRSALLAQTLERIESQTLPHEQFEVIVIDNDSTDDTRNVLEQRSRIYSNLRFGMQEKPGAAATRNVGLRMARGELLLFVDDDVQAEPGLIESHLAYQEKNPGASIIGAVTIPWGETTDPFLRYLRDHRILNPYTPSKGPIDFSYYHTCNVSTPTHLLLEVGGFNEAFCIYGMEDIELGYRLEQAGSRMMFAPEARALHYRFPKYQEFMQLCEQAGYSLGHLLSLHPELKKRFVENGRITRHLKGLHPLYKAGSIAILPVVSLLTAWEKSRGTGRVMRATDLHYTLSVRYYFFVGYQRYTKERTPTGGNRVLTTIQPSLAKNPSNER